MIQADRCIIKRAECRCSCERAHTRICALFLRIALPGPVTPGSTSVFFTWRRKRDPCQRAQTSSAPRALVVARQNGEFVLVRRGRRLLNLPAVGQNTTLVDWAFPRCVGTCRGSSGGPGHSGSQGLAGWLDTFRLVGFWFVICVAAGFPPFIPWGRWVGIR